MKRRERSGRRRWGLGLGAAALVAALLTTGAALDARRDAARMASAADALLTSLPPAQRSAATFALDGEERLRFHFIPPEMFERRGAWIRDMGQTQRQRVHDLLRAGLSQRGYMTAQQIIELEGILAALEGEDRRFARSPDDYAVAVFGTPSATGTWAWRFEGHHLSLHFTVVDGDVTVSTPTFLGANPAEVREGPRRGLRPLAEQEDLARQLVASLDAGQRAVAIFDAVAPRDIVTGASLEIDPLDPPGIRASALRPEQRALLQRLIASYTALVSEDIAAARQARVRRDGIDVVTFAWAGAIERGEGHYYRVQGPSFLIEYDNTQNDANHIHSVWRDFQGDFGRDLLREHLQQHPH